MNTISRSDFYKSHQATDKSTLTSTAFNIIFASYHEFLRILLNIPVIPQKWNLLFRKVVMILGVGNSREQMRALEDLLLCTGAPIAWEVITEDMKNEQDFNNMILAIKRNGLAIKGNLETEFPRGEMIPAMSKNIALRRVLDLHAFITEIKSYRGLSEKMKLHQPIDTVVVRQNTEGDSMMLEHSPNKRIVEHLKVTTLNNSERVAEAAFKYANKKNRKIVQCLHKRHILPLSEEIFIRGFLLAAARYPHIKYELKEIGTAFRTLIRNPKALDVVVTSSLDGLIMNAMLYGLLGSASLAAGSNIGDKIVVFEPAARYVDVQFVNPTAYFLSGALLLEHLGLTQYANSIRESLEELFFEKVFTVDLGGKENLFTFTKSVIHKVQKKLPYTLCSYNQAPSLPYEPKPIKPYIPVNI